MSEWEEMGANKSIVQLNKVGYKIPFKTEPSSVVLRNYRSALNDKDFVTRELQNLLNKGCVSKVDNIPKVVNPLTVAKNRNGKSRLVLDCRHINPHLHKFKYRYEDALVAKEMLQKGDFIFTFDLKSAYHHIEIFNDHRKFLGFSWEIDGRNQYYVFNVLPFGISTAGYIFTKVLREPVKFLRAKGMKIITFLDDGIGAKSCIDKAKNVSICVKQQLENLGFLFADDKCEWLPTQRRIWLGLLWDMEKGKIFITEDRIERLKSSLEFVHLKVMKNKMFFQVKELAKIVGQIISMKAVIGNTVRLKTRCLYDCIMSRASWHSKVKMSVNDFNEIEFWRESLNRLNENGCRLESFDASDVRNFQLFCDASDVGYSGFIECIWDENQKVSIGTVFGSWTENESQKSSTWRELEAVNTSNLFKIQAKDYPQNLCVEKIQMIPRCYRVCVHYIKTQVMF